MKFEPIPINFLIATNWITFALPLMERDYSKYGCEIKAFKALGANPKFANLILLVQIDNDLQNIKDCTKSSIENCMVIDSNFIYHQHIKIWECGFAAFPR